MKGASVELQEISLVALINDPYLMSKCMEEITENFFENFSFKLIYTCARKYYKKYMTLPTEKELEVLIRDSWVEEYGDLDEIIVNCKKLYEQEISSDDFIYEKVTEFIRRNKIEKSLDKVVRYMENKDIDLDQVAVDLRDSIYLNFSKSPVINLSDIGSIKEIREEALGPSDNPVIVKFFIDQVNSMMQYKGLIPGTLNMVTAPPGRGKTTMLINQGVATAKQGYRILHVFLGDMSRFDGYLRYLSCFSGVPTSSLVELSDDELAKFVQKWNMTGILNNIDIASYAADELNANQLIEEITAIQKDQRKHFNVIIVDYDENLSEEVDNMYKSGGQIYNKMALFAVLNKSVVFIASQPKTEYWKNEVIPLEAASESSKKQKIIDLMLTMGKPSKNSSIGSLHIAKNRRGKDGNTFRLRIDGDNARIEHISEEEYLREKSIENSNRTNNINN